MSTLKVNKIENTATSDGGIAIDSTGHVQLDGVQLPTAGQLSNRNLIINGALNVAQRGTSATSNSYATVDRWQSTFSQAAGTQSQLAFTSGDPYDEGFRYAYRLQVTSTSTNTSAYVNMTTLLEAQNIAQSGWKYKDPNHSLTCSFWVRSSLAGTYNVQYRAHDVSNFFFNRAFTVTANTWTKVTHTIPGHASLVFDNNANVGLGMEIAVHYGTDHTAGSVSNDTWFTLSGGNYFPDYAQSFANSADATFDVTGVQLEVGSKATPFEHRSYGDELARCLRYFQYYATNNTTAAYAGMGIAAGSASARFYFALIAAMRTVPSVTASSCSADDQQASTYTLSSPSIASGTIGSLYLSFSTSGMTGGRPIQLVIADGGHISLSAEL